VTLAFRMVCAARGVYRARRAKESPLWRIFDRHFDAFVGAYEERYAPRLGPLREVIPHAVREFLKCGILEWGFARIRCPECREEWLLGFS